jgi:hypothetical protein
MATAINEANVRDYLYVCGARDANEARRFFRVPACTEAFIIRHDDGRPVWAIEAPPDRRHSADEVILVLDLDSLIS